VASKRRHERASSLELRFDDILKTGRTDVVAEHRVRMVRDVGFDRLPVVLIVADALAVHADRQYFLQLLHFGERALQLM